MRHGTGGSLANQGQLGPAVAALAVGFSTLTLAAISMIGPAVLAPVATHDLGVPSEGIGVFVALNYLVAMFSGLVCGAFVARLGGLRVCQLAVLIAGLGLCLVGLGQVWLVLPAAAFIGIGYGWVNPSGSHIIVDRTPRNRLGIVLSIKQTGVPVGGAIAGAIVPTLTLRFGWAATIEMLGGACILAAVALALARNLLREPPRARPVEPFRLSVALFARPLGMVARSPTLMMLGFTSLVYSGLQLNITTYLVSYMNVGLGIPLVTAGLLFSGTLIAGICGRIFWGAVADRMRNPVRLMGMLGVVSGFCSVVLPWVGSTGSLVLLGALFVVYGATAVGWNGVHMALVARAAPDGEEGTATGGVQFLTFFGALAAPPVFAVCSALTGSYGIAFGLFGVVAFVLGLSLCFSRRLVA
jgi:MFS family permease